MNQNRLPYRFVIFGLLLLTPIVIAAQCAQPARTPPPTLTSPPPTPPPPEPGLPDYLFENQIIVIGLVNAIEQIVREAGAQLAVANLERQAQSSLEYFARLPESCTPLDSLDYIPPPDLNRDQLVLEMWQFQSSAPAQVAQLVNAINAAGAGQFVVAEPNYRVGRPVIEASGDSWCPVPSPTGAHFAPADQSAFWDQWALAEVTAGSVGIDLFNGNQTPIQSNVRVGVFDTSPFAEPGRHVVDWIDPPLTLQVIQPPTMASVPPPASLPPVQEHGLFVAGLVHGVAPGSDIQLIQVLDEHGSGDLATLNLALSQFIVDAVIDRAMGDLNGAVINLSLGVNQPPEPEALGLPAELLTTRALMAAAYCADIPVIAAAGNDSGGPAGLQPADYPAAWEEVIGVAASNQAGNLACFSNGVAAGDLAAPGGDGAFTAGACTAQVYDCATSPENCLVSLTSDGYAYWNGTSFATPLVSGLAALRFDQAGWVPRADLQNALTSGVTPAGVPMLGTGIINVPNTLATP